MDFVGNYDWLLGRIMKINRFIHVRGGKKNRDILYKIRAAVFAVDFLSGQGLRGF